DRPCATRDEQLDDLRLAAQRSLPDRRAAVRERPGDVGAVADQQLDALAHPVDDRPRELRVHEAARRVERVAEERLPWPAVTAAEPVLEQQLEVRVVAPELPVVEALAVVRVRARVEQRASELLPVRVTRLVPRT